KAAAGGATPAAVTSGSVTAPRNEAGFWPDEGGRNARLRDGRAGRAAGSEISASCRLNCFRSPRPSFFRSILQPPLCVQGGHPAGAGAGDGLAINVVLHVARGEDARHEIGRAHV